MADRDPLAEYLEEHFFYAYGDPWVEGNSDSIAASIRQKFDVTPKNDHECDTTNAGEVCYLDFPHHMDGSPSE
ncbi:hypothetical protein KNU14_gp62 [Gordonia phage Buggaboo]|uniref:Uncharacterized protein n=1 Tax=Gordonia phage Buggaboo TaxID=2315529 RepID=A0A386KDE8_9CAUD|nr:hypothetical protein KNU14_gp62 [Gordonia phage Buggaboo]AVE00716.1 hypothetical protein SEA_SUPERSULLEY_62 [Gordonia phage SuperSulley]AYD83254.1 hypothetical protein SEA_BUGGABOO_62 [Gordonia phage Buggaboo]